MDSFDKVLDKEIRKTNPIAVTEKKKGIKHQYGNYWKKLEARRIKKSEEIKEKRKASETSTQQTTKTSRQAIDIQQEQQLIILK